MDEVVIGIGINENKKTWFPTEKRVEMIEKLFADDPRVKVDAYDCLTIDFARAKEAQFIVRGIRTVHDFEYEEIQGFTIYETPEWRKTGSGSD
ncbi:phosphopantetheine adenylyltransferase, partial [human gut metagenome]